MAEGSTADCYCVCHSPVSSRSWCAHCKGDNEVGRRYRERSRLEREVIEKAKEWRELRLTHAETRSAVAALMDALDDLVYFESKQETK